MQSALDLRPARRRVLGVLLGVLGSALAHALIYAALNWKVTLPPIDFELQIPSHVEFGMTEPTPQSQPPVTPASPAPAEPAQPAPSEPAVTAAVAPPKPRIKKPKPAADAGVAEETTHERHPDAPNPQGEPALAAFAPAGAQIALRVNMARIRDSELAPDVRTLLEAVPDWHLILGGSGIDPLRDLERLYLASPDLKRSSVIIAGEYAGDDDLPQRAVANMAEARGVRAAWRTARGSIATAPWPNEDDTPRVVALIGPRQFAITRPDDLPRVLGVARALAKRRAEATGNDPEDDSDALLGLADGESLALSVEGAQAFARGNTRGIPERFELSVRQRDQGAFEVRVAGHFADHAAAKQARSYWDAMRDRYAGHILVALVGLREPLADAKLDVEGDQLIVLATIAPAQARTLLGFLHGALSPRGATSSQSGPRPAGP